MSSKLAANRTHAALIHPTSVGCFEIWWKNTTEIASRPPARQRDECLIEIACRLVLGLDKPLAIVFA